MISTYLVRLLYKLCAKALLESRVLHLVKNGAGAMFAKWACSSPHVPREDLSFLLARCSTLKRQPIFEELLFGSCRHLFLAAFVAPDQVHREQSVKLINGLMHCLA